MLKRNDYKISKQYTLLRSEEAQELISDKPEWIVRHGVMLMVILIAFSIVASALINYPEIVKTTLKINSLNAPKSILANRGGKLAVLLVKDGDLVKNKQVLAYLESTANHEDVLQLSIVLKDIQDNVSTTEMLDAAKLPTHLNLGELQGAYQGFYQEFLQYRATQGNGYYLKRREFLKKDLQDVKTLKQQILKQQLVQRQEYQNAESEYVAYQKLYQKKVISRSEFALQENKYLSSKYPLQQTETSLLNNASSYNSKEKELAELENTIVEQKATFIQALNQCVTEIDSWILQYVLRSPIDGKLSFAGIVQQNQNITANQEIFIVNPGSTAFFGEIQIPQYNMGKIKLGEKTLVKLRGYPFEQYGIIKGRLSYVSDVAYRDSVFIAKIQFDHFENKDPNKKIVLKNGMLADAEIITEESSLLERFFRNFTKMLNNSK